MQTEALVVVADGAVARAFRLTREAGAGAPLRIELAQELTRPDGRIKEGDRFSDSTPTGGRSRFGQAHSYSDHREGNDQEHKKTFARTVAEQVARVVMASSPRKVIIAVSNSIQSLLTQAVEAQPVLSERVNWLMGEFTGLSPAQLQRELLRRQLLPSVAAR